MDEIFMTRCLQLSRQALNNNELPIGCVITKDNEIIAESGNLVIANKDVTDHAEMVTMRQAQKLLGTTKLSNCVIYTTMEPCPMCSFMIRELQFKKVVFSIVSLDNGGYSKYKILQDPDLEKNPKYFNTVPEIVSGILEEATLELWEYRNQLKNI